MFDVELAATPSEKLCGETARINRGLTLAMVATCRAESERPASSYGLDAFEKAFAWHGGPGGMLETEARMFAAAHHAHDLLAEHQGNGELATTALTALAFAPGHAIVASLRDCCAFRVHAGAVEPISSATSSSPSSLAPPPMNADIDTFTVPAEPGDIFVVCTSRTGDVLSPARLLLAVAGAECASDLCAQLHDVLVRHGIEHAALAVALLVPESVRPSKPDLGPRPHRDSAPPPDAGARSGLERGLNCC